MMPEAYAKLLPTPPGPVYKYTSEDAGMLTIQNVRIFIVCYKMKKQSSERTVSIIIRAHMKKTTMVS